MLQCIDSIVCCSPLGRQQQNRYTRRRYKFVYKRANVFPLHFRHECHLRDQLFQLYQIRCRLDSLGQTQNTHEPKTTLGRCQRYFAIARKSMKLSNILDRFVQSLRLLRNRGKPLRHQLVVHRLNTSDISLHYFQQQAQQFLPNLDYMGRFQLLVCKPLCMYWIGMLR